MAHSRRKFLSLIGGGTVLAAAAATTGFVTTRTPTKAIAPWDMAGTYADPRKNALSYALLAPNPHNLQPWQVELIGQDTVAIYHDTSRRLPETDPFDRQIIIGFGCFLEQMKLAASAQGYNVALELFPQGEGGPVAVAQFTQGAEADPLSAYLMDRRSCKEPFEDRAVAANLIAELQNYADVHSAPDRVAQLKTLTWEAWLVEYETRRTFMESVDLMRFGKAEINANPDGIDLGGPFLESLMLAGLLTREAQADPTSTANKTGVDMYREMLGATPAYVSLRSATNTRADQVKAGADWLRLNLMTTKLGLSLHPVSQCLQEYPEMEPHYETAHLLLAEQGETVQMLGRLGYGPQIPRTPRWPLEAKLLNG